ncbi:tripartite tricarboxylate transporter permease [Sinisalibacter aestuarii]|uniref:C4-dicarboxylate ABC transporter permease n=1 Tax=Sinisalibacter aestuarii TaxID=2949426 RepID=A0ABQ5LQ12_9RHOB|nr:tripartite tricarboxylate transporter permease [Sinisalibacter aestuarii]GKY86833.1 C4-dicarboxylate ABC transporter permease [Sinisalibacter aestuarii]
MDIFLSALAMLTDPLVFGLLVAGTIGGIIIGALPGLGSIMGITMALPLTFVLSPAASLGLLLGIYCGSVFGGAISAILINTPGTPQSAATLLDGYPMARAGKASEAIGWATVASAAGGVIATLIFLVAAPTLASFGLMFGPIEYFALGVFALTCLAAVSRENVIKGLLAGLLGLFVATVGQDSITGAPRFSFGSYQLYGGVGLVPILVGLFALSEVFERMSERIEHATSITGKAGFHLPGLRDMYQRKFVFLKASIIGAGIGILPGIGAAASSMVAYAQAKRSSPNRENFGKGEPDGVIASEAANNAVTAGAMIPTLSLGVPGDPITAIMLGAMTIQGVIPGPNFFVNEADLGFFVFLALIVSSLALIPFTALLSPLVARLIKAPEPILFGGVVVLVMIGTFSISYNYLDLLVAFLSGIVGYVLRRNGIPLAPIVIGFVLGPMVESSLRQGMILTQGDFWAFFKSPIASILFAVTALSLVMPLWSARRLRRNAQTQNR